MNPKLSPREVEVLRAAGAGKTAKETADLIGVSPSAVNLYVARAMMKLQAKTKSQAIVMAIHKGFIG